MLECTVRIVRMGEDIFIKRKTTFDTLLYIWIFRTDCGFVRKKNVIKSIQSVGILCINMFPLSSFLGNRNRSVFRIGLVY